MQYASQELKRDREVVMEAVKQSGFALQFASEALREDREVCSATINMSSDAIYHV